MKRLLLLGLLIILCASATHAQATDISITPEEQSILPGETASFTLTINHHQGSTIPFRVYSSDIFWNIRAVEGTQVPPQGHSTTLEITPLQFSDPGVYRVPLTIKAPGIEAQRMQPIITIRSTEQVEYVPSLRVSASSASTIDPRREFPITITVENRNNRNLTGATIHLRSTLINEDQAFAIEPLETKEVTIGTTLDPLTAPQEDTLYVTISAPNGERAIRFDAATQNFAVVEYGDIEQQHVKTPRFLTLQEEITLTNTGNVEQSIPYAITKNIFSALFTTTEPATNREGGTLTWETTIPPQETRTLIIVTNYWPPFTVLLVIVLTIIAYFLLRSPITIIKKAKSRGKNELQVQLHIKNRSRREITVSDVSENVPRMFTVAAQQLAGARKPDKIAQMKSTRTNDILGTKVRWNIGALGRGEEMVLTYTIKSRLTMIGSIKLGPAKAHYKTRNKQTSVMSNSTQTPVQ